MIMDQLVSGARQIYFLIIITGTTAYDGTFTARAK